MTKLKCCNPKCGQVLLKTKDNFPVRIQGKGKLCIDCVYDTEVVMDDWGKFGTRFKNTKSEKVEKNIVDKVNRASKPKDIDKDKGRYLDVETGSFKEIEE